MRKSLRLAVPLLLVLATTSFAGIYYEQELNTANHTVKMVFYISGARMRVEVQGPGGDAVYISRFDQGKKYNLWPEKKTYFERPVPKLSPEEEAQLQVTVTKTDETKKIGNYSCTRYEVAGKGEPGVPSEWRTTQYWTTTDVDAADEFEKFWDAAYRAAGSVKLATEMAKIKGFRMQMVGTSPDGKVTTTETVTKVKKQDIPDSMFEVPADYKKVDAPALGAAPPPRGG